MIGFWFGCLVGFVIGCAFTLWNDRQKWNACPSGGFHYWEPCDDHDVGPPGNDDRFCTKCKVIEEEALYGVHHHH